MHCAYTHVYTHMHCSFTHVYHITYFIDHMPMYVYCFAHIHMYAHTHMYTHINEYTLTHVYKENTRHRSSA